MKAPESISPAQALANGQYHYLMAECGPSPRYATSLQAAARLFRRRQLFLDPLSPAQRREKRCVLPIGNDTVMT